jgi:flagellin
MANKSLSTGKRINSAKDDAAGPAIAASMTSQIRGMSQGIRNANDGISMAQTAEGALDEVTNMLQRMRELTVQAGNGTYASGDITNIKTEMTALAGQIDKVLTNTTFNGVTLFPATATSKSIQAGAEGADAISLSLSKPDLTAAVNGAALATATDVAAAGVDFTAASRIEDADFSTETTALAKAQILSQASTAMLAQANQSQQGVLKLLG